MGHADVKLSLGAGFDASAAVKAEKVGNAKPLDFDVFPNLVVHRAAFQFDGSVALPLQVGKHGTGANSTDGELFEKALVSLE
jgi:hypothetical protein